MGLSQRKDKQKIAPDPRNLGWSQGECSFDFSAGRDVNTRRDCKVVYGVGSLMNMHASFSFDLSGFYLAMNRLLFDLSRHAWPTI